MKNSIVLLLCIFETAVMAEGRQTEHEITRAHKNLNAEKKLLFMLSDSQMLYLSC